MRGWRRGRQLDDTALTAAHRRLPLIEAGIHGAALVSQLSLPGSGKLKAAIERKASGVRVFFAPTSLQAGGFWSAQLAREIADATGFILLGALRARRCAATPLFLGADCA